MKQADPCLVVHLGALGDFLVALPALERLAAEGELVVWGPSPARLRVAARPRGPVTSVAPLPHLLFAPPGTDPELDRRLEAMGRIVAFVRDEASPLVARVRALGGAIVPPFPPEGSGLAAPAFLLGELRARGLGASGGPTVPALAATPADLAAARDLLTARGVGPAPIVVHAGAGGRAKRWDPARFALVARELQGRLAARGEPRDVVALLGPAELDAPAEPALALPGVARAALENPPLETLLGLLATGCVFLGNDGGVAHLAAAAGAPVVAVFGPSDARTWAPRGRGPVAVVQAPDRDLARLEPGPVLAAALDVLERARAGPAPA